MWIFGRWSFCGKSCAGKVKFRSMIGGGIPGCKGGMDGDGELICSLFAVVFSWRNNDLAWVRATVHDRVSKT